MFYLKSQVPLEYPKKLNFQR